MRIGNAKSQGLAIMAFLCLSLVPASAQTKPPESTSKVKKVLLYNKIGGWLAHEGIAAVKATFPKLSAAKGFELVQLDTDSVITLDYLKQFQVIVWNNNTNGGSSVPGAKARQAVLDYLDQGGGWMLIGYAGDHSDSWDGLSETMGTNFSGHGGGPDRAEVVLDGAAQAHRELQWMVQGFPEVFQLDHLWFNFRNTVRPLPGVTVVATSRGVPGFPGVIFSRDGSGDNTYIWAREVGRGRLLYNAIGHGDSNFMAQKDSIIPRLYWQNLRYAAGDFQNGCTTPGSPGFDPAARVHVEAMCAVTGLGAAPARPDLLLSKGGRRMRISVPGGPLQVRLRDLRGALVRERVLPVGTRELALDDALKPGIYPIEIRGSDGAVRHRLVLP